MSAELEPPPPCAKCSKAITFAPFTVTVIEGAYATFHQACAPKRLERIAAGAQADDSARPEVLPRVQEDHRAA